MGIIKEFLGIGGYTRKPEGYMSWQHITFVLILMTAMVALAVYLGLINRNKSDKHKNKVLIWSAFLINGFEIFKIVVLCIRGNDPMAWLYSLPLFLCSIQLITIPLAAFSRGRVRDASLDFVMIFGILGAVLGTIGAGQNYNAYPVLSMDNVVSGITHCISGFASLYIAFAKMKSMKKSNVLISFGIITVVSTLAYITNITIDYNYMFLMAGDGTPYDILYNLVGGHKVFYPLSVVALLFIYIALFYLIYYGVKGYQTKKAAKKEVAEHSTPTIQEDVVINNV